MTVPPPPKDFQGVFATSGPLLDEHGGASGPFQHRPAAVARPAHAADVAALLAWASETGVAVVPRGAGTGMPGGNVGPGLVVDLRGLDRLGPVEGDRVRAGPGVVAGRVQEAAEAAGRFFPALPSSSGRCTIGGMVANNAAGARSFGYGAVHAWVEAVELVTADGRIERLRRGDPPTPEWATLHADVRRTWPSLEGAWPRVRKNSSGYALDRWMARGDALEVVVGSEGTLGIVTDIELRLAASPVARRVALLPVARESELAEVVAEVASLGGAAAIEFLGARFLDIAGLRTDPAAGGALADAEAALLVELDDRHGTLAADAGALATVARRRGRATLSADDAPARARLWSLRHAASPVIAARAAEGLVSMQFIEDSVVPPHALAHYLRRLQDVLASETTDAVLFGHAGDANVHVNPLIDVRRDDWRDRVGRILDATASLVADLGGTLSGEHGDGRVRTPHGPTIWGGDVLAAFRRVKDALDPAGVLNPGVIVPLPGQDPLHGLVAAGGRR